MTSPKSKTRTTAIVLAAGKGTRMHSTLPKVLHPAAGLPLILRPIQACFDAGVDEVRVVVGHGKELVTQVIEPTGARAFVQLSQNGTAHAVKSANLETISGDVIIINGDHPLISANDLKHFIQTFREEKAGLAVVTCELEDPGSYGRIVRHKGIVRAIVEAKDASAETLQIKEINTGLYVVSAEVLVENLNQIQSYNKQNEYYLTDIVALANENGEKVIGIKSGVHVATGINNQLELSRASKDLFKKKIEALMASGVIVIDPENTYVEEDVEVGQASVLYPGVYLKGKTKLGPFCVVEPHSMIIDSVLAESVEVKASCYIEGAKIATRCTIGPFARLRPDADLAEDVKIGNFVEVKKSKLAKGVKAGHLTYIGDAEIGENTNIGCGTITCNYAVDKKKYKTIIGKDVFVGSDTQFVAPITIGDGAVIGSGSTITKDVPAGSLAVARGRQFVKEDYIPKKG